MVICPICRSKPIKIRDGVDIKKVVKNIKGADPNEKNIKQIKTD